MTAPAADLDTYVQDLIERKLCHEIHTSECKSFRGCRRRWDWISRQHYYPIVTAKPLEFGVAYHKAMEVFYNPDTWEWDREVRVELAVSAFVDVCEEQYQAALQANDAGFFTQDIEDDYNERKELGIGMIRYYFGEISPITDRGWKPVKVEVKFMVTVPNPETGDKYMWCKCDECWDKFQKFLQDWSKGDPKQPIWSMLRGAMDRSYWRGLPVVYAGRVDMLAEDDSGYYWIFDWKTAAQIRDDTSFLYLDDQIGRYIWALRKVGLNVRGFVYHEQRKGYPKAPNENKQRRLGCKFSVSKQQNTDYDTYLAHVMAHDKEAYDEGCYDEFLEFLKNEGITYHRRMQVAKSDYECDQVEKNIGYEILDMLDINLRVYPSAGRFSCQWCAFQQPCLSKNDGSDYQYALDTMFEKREHYYVRQEASTETKGGE